MSLLLFGVQNKYIQLAVYIYNIIQENSFPCYGKILNRVGAQEIPIDHFELLL